MGKRITYYCDCCGREIKNGDGRYRVQISSATAYCKVKVTAKTACLCEDCLEKTFKNLSDEGEEE